MKFRLILIPFLILIISLNLKIQITNGQNSQDTSGEIDAFLEEEMDSLLIPGLSINIVENNKTTYLNGLGRANNSGGLITPQTPFPIGSLTEAFTALAVMQLNDSALININNPIKDYISWFKTSDEEISSKITVKQCLIHLSGISADTYSSVKSGDTLSEFIHSLSEENRINQPGKEFEYSRTNYLILGQLIESVSGQSYAEYVKNNICEPLNMTNTYFTQEDASNHGLTEGYQILFGIPRIKKKEYNSIYASSEGIYSTASDMGNWMIVQLNSGHFGNKKIVSEDSMRFLHSVPNEIKNFTTYSMGWGNTTTNNSSYLSNIGFLQNYHIDINLHLSNKTGIIIMMNINSFMGDNLIYIRSIVPNLFKILNHEDIELRKLSYKILSLIINIAFLFSLIWEGIKFYKFKEKNRKFIDQFRDYDEKRNQARGKFIVDFILVALILFGLPWFLGWFLGSKFNFFYLSIMQPGYAIFLAFLASSSLIQGILRIFLFKKEFN